MGAGFSVPSRGLNHMVPPPNPLGSGYNPYREPEKRVPLSYAEALSNSRKEIHKKSFWDSPLLFGLLIILITLILVLTPVFFIMSSKGANDKSETKPAIEYVEKHVINKRIDSGVRSVLLPSIGSVGGVKIGGMRQVNQPYTHYILVFEDESEKVVSKEIYDLVVIDSKINIRMN